ncbi:MAG: EAL domain-containing protein [Actinomycetota bacterium]
MTISDDLELDTTADDLRDELTLARRRFQLAFDEAAIGMALVELDGRFIDANASLCTLFGRSREELTTIRFPDVTHEDDLAADVEHVREMIEGRRTTYQTQKRYLRPDGSVIWGLLSVSIVRSEVGEPDHFIVQIQDRSEHQRAEDQLARTIEELERNERRYRSLIEPSVDLVARIGIDGRVEDLNQCAAGAIGGPRDEMIGRHLNEVLPEALANSILDGVTSVSSTGRPDEMWREWLEPADGLPGWFLIRVLPVEPQNGSGYVEHVHLIASDITELVENEQRLSQMALVDPLTGLSNRAAVFDRLQHALDRLDRHPVPGVVVALIDLDRFKAINDTFGHSAGDDALRAVADALQGVARPEDTVGRLGGDEFVVVFEGIPDRDRAGELGRRLVEKLVGTTVDVGDGRPHGLSGSVGVAFTDTVLPINDLIARADRAMYQAKNRGRGRSWVEDGDETGSSASSGAMLRELTAALSKREFELHYQPIARSEDLRVVGFEALLRWRHPERGLVPPIEFLDSLFSTGEIEPVGQWVVRTAVEQLAEWQRRPQTEHLQMHINASPAELASPGFVATLRDEFSARSVDPARLSIEITEQALAGSIVSGAALAEIASTGARLILDDFGTGVSSLSHLRTRPLHGIKIDRSFVSGADTDDCERAIAESVIQLGSALGVEVTAEGVETEAQAEWLRTVGAPLLQGWYVGMPQPIGDVVEPPSAG